MSVLPPTRDAGAAEELLVQLSSLLDDAQEPMKRFDLPQVEACTRTQQELIERLGPFLEGQRPDVSGDLVTTVRRKLLRNQVMVAHVLDFTTRFQAHISRSEDDGYDAEGQTRQGAAAGRMLRTSV